MKTLAFVGSSLKFKIFLYTYFKPNDVNTENQIVFISFSETC
jgi:hypothetical protein